jgi:hypothetical protein
MQVSCKCISTTCYLRYRSRSGLHQHSGGALHGSRDARPGGEDVEGSAEGNNTHMMSTDRCRAGNSWEPGDQEFPGAGGSTKWNVREAICICELCTYQKDKTREDRKGLTARSRELCFPYHTTSHPPKRRSCRARQ